MVRLICVFSLAFPAMAFAQKQPPGELYAQRIDKARAEYRIAIAEQIRNAKSIELFLLKFDDVKNVDLFNDEERRFPVAPYAATTGVISMRTLSANESRELVDALANQIAMPIHTGGAFCHYPVHGVRIISDQPGGEAFDGEAVYSGTFCWHCGNFGFEYPDAAEWLSTNETLKELFNKLLPVPKAEVERFETVHQSKSEPVSPP